MKIKNYFKSQPEIQRMMRNKMLYKLEVMYADEVMDLDEDEPVPENFETFLDRTIQDMLLFENYEGAALIKDIKKEHGWK